MRSLAVMDPDEAEDVSFSIQMHTDFCCDHSRPGKIARNILRSNHDGVSKVAGLGKVLMMLEERKGPYRVGRGG